MWVLAIIIAVLAAIVAVVLIAAMLRSKEFRVERSILSTASAKDIYTVFSDLHRWREWSPYDKRDPAMKMEYSGPALGAGSSYSWNGNSQVGSGRLTIVRAEPDTLVELKLEFFRPFKATNKAMWRVDEEGGQRRITWSMDSVNDNLMTRIVSVFMNMDKMVGTDFEAGLALLKAITERKSSY